MCNINKRPGIIFTSSKNEWEVFVSRVEEKLSSKDTFAFDYKASEIRSLIEEKNIEIETIQQEFKNFKEYRKFEEIAVKPHPHYPDSFVVSTVNLKKDGEIIGKVSLTRENTLFEIIVDEETKPLVDFVVAVMTRTSGNVNAVKEWLQQIVEKE